MVRCCGIRAYIFHHCLQSNERPRKKKNQDTRSQRLKRQQKTVKCKNCGVLGHNSKTCHRRASNEEAVMGSHNVQAPQDDRGGSNMSRDDGGGSSSVHITKKQRNHPTVLPLVFEEHQEPEEIDVPILTQMSQSKSAATTHIEGPLMWDQLQRGRTRGPPVDDTLQKNFHGIHPT
ncbi:gag-pol polyprotein [Striga asiatica]|uniref:Gag-pol polyprotein n=1 Tax=Striga asiatica TaxID=4170 RepID=A0A5A7QZF6_STRAF|nr:gag-pol polyprotein [Striga asiatica]